MNRRRRLRKNEQRREVERRASSQARAEREAETCSAKSSYPSNAEALRAAGWVKSQNPGSAQLATYQCDVCGQWHLTSRGR